MNFQIRREMSKARLLFVIDSCPECAKWKEFIERLNIEVPIDKRIRVINCTIYNSLGVFDRQILKLYDRYMEGNYPFLFFYKQFNGANSRVEVEAFIRAALHKDFIVKRHNPFMFNQNCKFVKRGLLGKQTVVCGEQ